MDVCKKKESDALEVADSTSPVGKPSASCPAASIPTLGSSGLVSPREWTQQLDALHAPPLLAGQWAQKLDGLQQNLATTCRDLQLAAAPPDLHIVTNVGSWQTGLRAARIEAERWHQHERDRISADSLKLQLSNTKAVNASAKAEAQELHHRRQLQTQEDGLEEISAQLRAACMAKSELRVAQAECKELRETLQLKDTEYDAMLFTSMKQDAAMQKIWSELDGLRADTCTLREQFQLKDDTTKETRAELGLMRMDARELVWQIRAKDAEHQRMMLASKEQNVSVQTRGANISSVKDQLHEAMVREVLGEQRQEELKQRCSSYVETLQRMQENVNAQEVELHGLKAALAETAVSHARRDESIVEAEARAKQVEKALESSGAETVELETEVSRMKNLRLLSNSALSNAETIQVEYANDIKALQGVNRQLRERGRSLEAALVSSMKKELLLERKAEELSESQKLYTSLQAKAKSLEAALSISEANMAQLASIGSLTARSANQRDYPQSVHSAKLRTAVLSARGLERIAAVDR